MKPDPKQLVTCARRALLLDLLANGSATADDVWDALDLPTDTDARWLGAVPGVLARLGIIRAAGRVRSVRPERHGAHVVLWALADRAAAERWLADHPDPSDGQAGAQAMLSSPSPKPKIDTGAAVTTAAPVMEA